MTDYINRLLTILLTSELVDAALSAQRFQTTWRMCIKQFSKCKIHYTVRKMILYLKVEMAVIILKEVNLGRTYAYIIYDILFF